MKRLISLITCLSLTSCTYNISMSHTSGGSTDTIEDSATDSPNIAPNLTIPASVI